MCPRSIVQDKAQVPHKSQQLENPAIITDPFYSILRTFINSDNYDDKELEVISEKISVPIEYLKDDEKLENHIKDKYGLLKIGKKGVTVTWKRKDKGPDVTFRIEDNYNKILIKIFLMTQLIEYFKYLNFSSYEEIKRTQNWNKCTVYLDDNEIDNLIWACSLMGICLKLSKNDKGNESVRKLHYGHILIKLHETEKTFF